MELSKREAFVEVTLTGIHDMWEARGFEWEQRSVAGPVWRGGAQASGYPGGIGAALADTTTTVHLIANGASIGEAIEDQLVALQTLSSAEAARAFHNRIRTWQDRLGHAAAVLRAWMEVGRQSLVSSPSRVADFARSTHVQVQLDWLHLSALFLGEGTSADELRAKFAPEALLFRVIHADFVEVQVSVWCCPVVPAIALTPHAFASVDRLPRASKA